jgi:hypothetical protein
VSEVAFYHAPGCHLCELAREQLALLQVELGFAVREVDIAGVPALERVYRPWIPVEGERISVYRLDEPALRERLAAPAVERHNQGA